MAVIVGIELREDGGNELEELGGLELREIAFVSHSINGWWVNSRGGIGYYYDDTTDVLPVYPE